MPDDNYERNEESNRTSIWSVRTEDRLQFSVIFFTLFIVGLIIVVCYEVLVVDSQSIFAAVIALIRDVGAVGIASLTITEGGEVVGIGLEWYRKQRYNAGYKAGLEEGRRLEREAQQRSQSDQKPEAKGGKDNKR